MKRFLVLAALIAAIVGITACEIAKADLTPLVLQEVRVTGLEADREITDYIQTTLAGKLLETGMVHGENGAVIDVASKWTGDRGSFDRTVELRGQMMDPKGLSYSIAVATTAREFIKAATPDKDIASVAAARFRDALTTQFQTQREKRPNAYSSNSPTAAPQPGTYTSSSKPRPPATPTKP